MIRNTLKRLFSFKVSGNVSEDLILNLSMGLQTNSFLTQEHLVSELKKRKFIWSNDVESTMQKIDRSHFTISKDKSFYDLIALDLPRNQKMPVPIIHSIILESFSSIISETKPSNVEVIDFGCGGGYLTFAFHELSKLNKIPEFKVTGFDLYEECIEICLKNKKIYELEDLDSIGFNVLSLEQFTQNSIPNSKEISRIVNLGFAIDNEVINELSKFSDFIIGPVWETQDEQYLIQYNCGTKESKKLYKCVFSGQIDHSKTSPSLQDEISNLKSEVDFEEKKFKKLHDSLKSANPNSSLLDLISNSEYKSLIESIRKLKRKLQIISKYK